jgi:competence protein ComEC
VSVGAGNDYGHPRASILAVLRRLGALIARSDTDGAVVVWRDGGALRIWRGGVGPPD